MSKLFKKLAESIESPVKKDMSNISEADESALIFGNMLENISSLLGNSSPILEYYDDNDPETIRKYKEFIIQQNKVQAEFDAKRDPVLRAKLEKQKREEEKLRRKIEQDEKKQKAKELKERNAKERKAASRTSSYAIPAGTFMSSESDSSPYEQYDIMFSELNTEVKNAIVQYDVLSPREFIGAIVDAYEKLNRINSAPEFRKLPTSYKKKDLYIYTRADLNNYIKHYMGGYDK